MSRRRVVVTGVGALTPVGHTMAETWDSLIAGRSGVGTITHFDASRLPSHLGAEITGWRAEDHFDKRTARRSDPFVLYAVAAAREAMQQAGLQVDEANADRVGVVFGSGIGGLQTWDEGSRALYERGPDRVSPFFIPMLIGNMAAGLVSIEFGATGPNKSIQTACATSAHCVGDAYRIIQMGEADAVIAGGSEMPFIELACAGFCSMRALSTRNDDPAGSSRPFDHDRDGFVMAEGAGAMVLESLEHAEARGADILAELIGYGATADAYHMAVPKPGGTGAMAAMQDALNEAGLTIHDVDYINAHATSTEAGDVAEVAAIRTLVGNGRPPMPVGATKSMTGHMLGAAGAVELAFCVQAMRTGVLPPTINQDQPDPDCDVDSVPNEAREADVKVALSNSFGFGGHNCSLLVRKL